MLIAPATLVCYYYIRPFLKGKGAFSFLNMVSLEDSFNRFVILNAISILPNVGIKPSAIQPMDSNNSIYLMI
jgi:hypothetical protein